MLIIEFQGNQVQFDVEQLIERIDGIENCLQLVLMEIVNYLFKTMCYKDGNTKDWEGCNSCSSIWNYWATQVKKYLRVDCPIL